MINKNDIQSQFPKMNIIEIIYPNDEKYKTLHKNLWKMPAKTQQFSFSTNGEIDENLYQTSKIQARQLFIEKIKSINNEFAYINIQLHKQNMLLKLNIESIFPYIETLFNYCFYKVFNEQELIILQKGEYEWEVVFNIHD